MKRWIFDPSDTYLDAYPDTYPHNVRFVKSPAQRNIPRNIPRNILRKLHRNIPRNIPPNHIPIQTYFFDLGLAGNAHICIHISNHFSLQTGTDKALYR